MTPRLLLTGATGTIGRRMVRSFEGTRVLSRDPVRAAAALAGADARAWDGRARIEADTFAGIDAVVHLAGEPVAGGRWSPARKTAIRDSRVLGTRALVESLEASPARPAVLLCASAVGYYGDRGEESLDETAPAGRGFLAEVCQAWEGEAIAASALGMRVVCLRLGVVLERGGGALAEMERPFRWGLGGTLGTGRQWMPWIHAEDVVRLVGHALGRGEIVGPLNAVGPTPARNVEVVRALGRVLHRPSSLPVPAFALRVALGEGADVVLASQRVSPAVALQSGFVFTFRTVLEALEDLYGAAPG